MLPKIYGIFQLSLKYSNWLKIVFNVQFIITSKAYNVSDLSNNIHKILISTHMILFILHCYYCTTNIAFFITNLLLVKIKT